jgi:hypothetical protein
MLPFVTFSVQVDYLSLHLDIQTVPGKRFKIIRSINFVVRNIKP